MYRVSVRFFRLVALLITLFAIGSKPLSAPPIRSLDVRSPADWKLEEKMGDFPTSVSVMRINDPVTAVWVFRGNAMEGKTDQRVYYRLYLKDYGLPPQPLEAAEYWVWSWYVRNTETADYVAIKLVDEHGATLELGASHAIYDYSGHDYLATPTRFTETHYTLTEAFAFPGHKPQPSRTELGRIVAVELQIALPHEQEIWLGPIGFGPARTKPVPPAPRARQELAGEGYCYPVDLDGDGLIEVLTPWLSGDKLWRYDKSRGEFVRSKRSDALSSAAQFDLMVTGDLDGDGDLDLVAVGAGGRKLWILRNRVYGFTGKALVIPKPEPGSILTAAALADDDGDGDLDLFLGYHMINADSVARVYRLSGLGNGDFLQLTPIPASATAQLPGTYHLALIDMNGDGILDIVTAAGGVGLVVIPGKGGGEYAPIVTVDNMPFSDSLRSLAFADLDGNGYVDVYAAMFNRLLAPARSGRNYLFLNRGGFHFDEASDSLGVLGSNQTQDAGFYDLTPDPGLELLTLEEEGGLVAHSINGSQVPELSQRTLLSPAITVGAKSFFCQDLDRDGSVEIILSEEGGPAVVRLPKSGPVQTVLAHGLGVSAQGLGESLVFDADRASAWGIPIFSSSRSGPLPVLFSSTGIPRLQSRSATPLPTSPFTLTFQLSGTGTTRFAGELRAKRPYLWEYPYAIIRHPAFRWGMVVLLSLGLGLVSLSIRRRTRRRTERQNWLDLLSRVGLHAHADWKKSLASLVRVARLMRSEAGSRNPNLTTEQRAQLRQSLPKEVLGKCLESVDLAQDLGLDGGKSGASAVRTLGRIHSNSPTELDQILRAGQVLDSSLGLIQQALTDRFTCDPKNVLQNLRAFRKDDESTTRIVWEPQDGVLSSRFPLCSEDLFACLDELLSNALKKVPQPSTIRVRVRNSSPLRAQLVVWDDGAPLDVEKSRKERPGTRAGLNLLRNLLLPYGGNLHLVDDGDRGTEAIVEVPKFST